MFTTVQAFYIWRTLYLSKSISEVGAEIAQKNIETTKRHINFLMPAERNHLFAFIIGISKFFDPHRRSLSIAKLISKVKESKEAEIITPDDEREIQDLKSKFIPLITELKKIRNKAAHIDTKPIDGTFIPNEVEALINTIQQMLNKISLRLDGSSTIWHHLKDDTIADTNLVLENLYRGEAQKMKDIEEKWKM